MKKLLIAALAVITLGMGTAAQAAAVVIETGHRPYYRHHQRYVWVEGHRAWIHGHRVWVEGHYVVAR